MQCTRLIGPGLACLLVGAMVSSLGLRPAAAAEPPIWEPAFGAGLSLGDDTSDTVNLGFNFPFLGSSYNSAVIGSNGIITFGAGDGSGPLDGTPTTLLNGSPEIAVASYDLNPSSEGEVRFNSFPGSAVVTWDQVPEFSNSDAPNLFQAQLFDTGRIVLGYDLLTPLETNGHRHHGVVGVSPGGGAADPGELDYTSLGIFDSGSETTVYEFFERGPNGAAGGTPDTWDLAGGNIVFTPNRAGGWVVETTFIPEPASLLLVSLAGLFGCARRMRA